MRVKFCRCCGYKYNNREGSKLNDNYCSYDCCLYEEDKANIPTSITFTMKTPDIVYNIIKSLNLNKDHKEELQRKLEQWFQFGENITLEYDTVNDTMKVIH